MGDLALKLATLGDGANDGENELGYRNGIISIAKRDPFVPRLSVHADQKVRADLANRVTECKLQIFAIMQNYRGLFTRMKD